MDRRLALESYEYRTDCSSVLYPALKRYWYTPILGLVPLTVSANALTLAGAILSWLSFVACYAITARPDLDLLLIACGLLFWAYNTLDNVDGPQARRTGTSGPMGELFDHGADSFTVFLFPLGILAALEVPEMQMTLVIGLCALAFWASMWEVYWTGVLVTSELSDVEASVIITIYLLVAGVTGLDVMREPTMVFGLSTVEILVFSAYGGFGAQIAQCLFRGGDWSRRAQVLPLLATIGLFVLWRSFSGGGVSGVAAAALIGLAGARSSMELITARLYKEPPHVYSRAALAIAVIGLLLAAAGVSPEWQGLGAQAGVVWLTALGALELVQGVRTISKVTERPVFKLPEAVAATP